MDYRQLGRTDLRVSAVCLGTMTFGEQTGAEDALRQMDLALDRGINFIDTAEMYANGGAEKVVGAAMDGFGDVARDDMFIVSKVLPGNAHHDDVLAACERSLKRLGTDYIDMYLLHWRGAAPFSETIEAFEVLRNDGKIRHFGVSNLDKSDMEEWLYCPGGKALACNQILYNLSRRGPEWDLLPFCENQGVPVMAYSPLEQGRLQGDPALDQVAARYGVNPLQIALAWVLARDNVMAIPKAVNHTHIDENIAALDIVLDAEDHAVLDAAFPPPSGPSYLEML